MIVLRSGLILAGILALGACGAPHQESHLNIVNGSQVSQTDPVAAVTVALVTESGDAFCTGTLIAQDRVLTAGHCLDGIADQPISIMFGLIANSELNSASENSIDTVVAKNSLIHPQFNLPEPDPDDEDGYGASAYYDLALVKLAKPAPESFRTAPLVKATDKITKGERLILAGFGETKTSEEPFGILRKVETTFERGLHDDLEFEITPGERNSCHGDSGGPAFIERNGKLMLLGVVSRGDMYCQRTGIYTDVRPFRAFANKTL